GDVLDAVATLAVGGGPDFFVAEVDDLHAHASPRYRAAVGPRDRAVHGEAAVEHDFETFVAALLQPHVPLLPAGEARRGDFHQGSAAVQPSEGEAALPIAGRAELRP